MPISPPRICHKHKTPFSGRRCPVCEEEWKKKNRENDNRESSSKRGYDRHWSKIRSVKLSTDPFCERCTTKGKTVPAKIVHHKDRNAWNRSFDNLESICKDCHNEEHREELFGHDKNGSAMKKGCGTDGKPEGWE